MASTTNAAVRVKFRLSEKPKYACPRCYSTQVAVQQERNPWEWALYRLGMRNIRCKQCQNRFVWF